MSLRPSLLLLIWLSAAGVQAREIQHEFFVEVRRVLDGDTLQVIYQGQIELLRLLCIDAPELGRDPQPWGREARDFLRKRIQPKQILLVITAPVERGSEKQLLGTVYETNPRVGTESLNLALVKQGMAWAAYPDSCPDPTVFDSAQKAAQAEKLGLWNLPDPVLPSIYRLRLNR